MREPSLVKDFCCELVQVIAPIGPSMIASGFFRGRSYSVLLKELNRSCAVCVGNVILADANPIQPKRLTRCFVSGEIRLLLLLPHVREPARTKHSDICKQIRPRERWRLVFTNRPNSARSVPVYVPRRFGTFAHLGVL